MQMPSIQPADVFTPIKEAGQAAAGALTDIGKSVDVYNEMNRLLKDKRGRALLRAQLVKEAGVSDSELPKDMSADDLSKFSNRVNAFKAMLPDIEKYKVMSAAEKRVISLAASAVGEKDDGPFWKLLAEADAAIQKKKGVQEVAAESGRLQDISTGLTSEQGPIEMPGIPNMPAPGPQEESQRMKDVGTGMATQPKAKSMYTGEPTREGALKAEAAAGVNVEGVGEASQKAYEKQFRSEADIAAATFKETDAGSGGADKSQEKMSKLENEINGLKKLKIDVRNYREKLKDKGGNISQQMITALAASDPEFAKITGGNTDPAAVERMLEEHDASVSRQIISKGKQFNTYAPSGLDMKIGEYVDFVAGVEKKYGKAKPGKAGAKPAANPEARARTAYEASPSAKASGLTFDEFKVKFPDKYAIVIGRFK